jgi:hypothetical protein
MKSRHLRATGFLCGAFLAGNLLAQDVLVSQAGGSGGFASNPIGQALRDLDLRYTDAGTITELFDQLSTREWDLVIIRRRNALTATPILLELREHLDRGGALHFQITNLEDMSDAWHDLLGLEDAVDLELPLSEIELAPPKHPSVPGGGFLSLRDETYPPDYGDALVPAHGSTATQRYLVDERASTVLSRGGRVLVNGQQWDNWVGGSGAALAAGQIRWLLRCPADLDLDGAATINDFLVFQNLFMLEDTVADIDVDGAWTVFDFLAFLNIFEDGC